MGYARKCHEFEVTNGIFYRISEDEESGDVEIKLYHALNCGQLKK